MADLLSILSQSASSLTAQSGLAATASNNIQNANTDGYSRQTAVLADVLPAERVGGAYIGRGSTLQTVSQSRNRFLEAQLPAAFSAASKSSAESATLSGVTALDPDGGAGLSSALGDFYSSLTALSQNPGDSSLRQAAVSTAKALTLAFNGAASSLNAARSGVDADVSGNIATVNALAQSVASLNAQIAIARASGGQPNDLLDARQKAQDQLATLVGAVPIPDAKGNINLSFPNGQSLVSGNTASTVAAVSDPSNGGHVALTLASGGAPPKPLLSTNVGGGLGGELAARDGALKTAGESLDTLAFDFANTVNAVHQAGYGLDGSTGQALFDTTATSAGAAAKLAVDPAVLGNPGKLAAASSAGTLPGDGANLLSVIQTEKTALSTGSNVSATLSNLTAAFGSAAANSATVSAHDAAISANLTGLRESTSGVSIDEEMVTLTRAQRGYEAVAKVLQTTNDMLDTLMSIKST